ncbi:arpA protein [Pseudonocardia sp.]|uniref:HalD/BesD family halogenase n=1 Tax=Pseudonocardia sp. TaxID=60912 RepID=UPI0026074846|nr:arpA protein [Pseudonocardia sp.]MCW2721856.1 arpA protein [Pseudonocardia sp.]
MTVVDVADAIDTDTYELTDPVLVARVREDLASAGCCVLPDFVRPDVRETLRREGAKMAPGAYYDVETVNVYNTEPDPSLPDGHPARVPMERGNAFVARDLVPPDAVIHRLYTSPAFQGFVAACFGLDAVHELADPLSGLTLNVLTPGRSHPWHFDTNEFTVSMLMQAPQVGGVFEFCPAIRSAASENVDDVRAVVDGRGEHLVRRLTLRPGDLQLFMGRYALHRVSTVEGGRARHSAIFAYSERAGVIGSVSRTRQLFGRVTPAHLEATGGAVRGDQLMD